MRTINELPGCHQHERVMFVNDDASGLRAIIAIHSTAAGPACGGIRFWPYPDDETALIDVLRLSEGMSYKNVMAGLPIGGGKAVIIADANRTKSRARLLAFGAAVDRLKGRYIAAEDVGITVDDVCIIREATSYVAGLDHGAHGSGDPSPFTAHGVFLGLEAAVRHALKTDLKGLLVGVMGLGAVGLKLAQELHRAGAALLVADLDPDRARAAAAAFGARVVAPKELFEQPLDVFAPCALGGVLTPATIERLQAKVVAGAANNQLLDAASGRLLHERGILYAPDFVINAGGVINVAGEIAKVYDRAASKRAIARIPKTLDAIFNEAARQNRPTSDIAYDMARARLEALERERQRAA